MEEACTTFNLKETTDQIENNKYQVCIDKIDVQRNMLRDALVTHSLGQWPNRYHVKIALKLLDLYYGKQHSHVEIDSTENYMCGFQNFRSM